MLNFLWSIVCQYKFFNGGTELNRTLTNCRFSITDKHTFWEEFDQKNEYISSGEITSLSETEFSVKILDNGIDADKFEEANIDENNAPAVLVENLENSIFLKNILFHQ